MSNSMSRDATVAQVCLDMAELYDIYSNNWFDVEGNPVPIDSVTLQVIRNDCEESNMKIALFLTMADVTEDSLFQVIGSGLSEEEVNAVVEFGRAAFNCDVAVISVA